ncbi:MAG: histidine--tRNA ligase [Patescibacteria group bacterium]
MPSKKNIKPTFQSVKGMHDILPQEQPYWDKVRKAAKDIADYYNFSRIDTPIVERAELFERTSGESSEVVERQMFVFKDKDDNRLALRPEGTAPVARAYVQNGLSRLPHPLKLFYLFPMFRYEQPQAGRARQHHQIGFEIIGDNSDPVYDAQTILVAYRLAEELKIPKLSIQINSIGCKNCRPIFKKKLLDYYKNQEPCKDCKRRLTVNPMRVLDCKNEVCQPIKQGAPTTIDSLCGYCNNHFKSVLEYLEELKLPYSLNNSLVRGLDYYSRTVFEIVAEGVDVSLGGGGRYDYLVEQLGGRPTAANGFGMGVERLILAMQKAGVQLNPKVKPKVFFIQIGALAKKKSLPLIEGLRKLNIEVLESLGKESLKPQLRLADKETAKLALIFGQKEAFEESIIIRDLQTGAQETVQLKKLVEEIKKRI